MKVLLKNITKTYGTQTVVENVSIEFSEGIYGLLGPNGAGKSTLINIIIGIVKADKGAIFFNDVPRNDLGDDFLKEIGYMPQNICFYNNYSVREFMRYMCAIKGVKASDELIIDLLRRVNLEEKYKSRISTLSGGMKQRLGIAQTLIGNPKFIIMDEPTAGLDPIERARFREIVANISRERIVLIVTHIVSDIEFSADHIIFMKSGQVVLDESKEEVLRKLNGKVKLINISTKELADYEQRFSICNVRNSEVGYELRIVTDVDPEVPFQNIEPSIEDVYVYYGMHEGKEK